MVSHLHKRAGHGRVLHGQEAHDMVNVDKRQNDDEGMSNKDRFINNSHQDDSNDNDDSDESPKTVAHAVYITMPKTFDGPAAYVTSTAESSPDRTAMAPAPRPTEDRGMPNFYEGGSKDPDDFSKDAPSNTSPKTAESQTTAEATREKDDSSASATPTMDKIATSSDSSSSDSSDSSDSTSSASLVGAAAADSPSATSKSADMIDKDGSGEGMSGGAKAGLAIGIILGLALAAGLAFFCWRRRKNQNQTPDEAGEQPMGEKHNSSMGTNAPAGAGMGAGVAAGVGAGAAAGMAIRNNRESVQSEKVPSSLRSTRTASTAPRLSLRPVTQFLPNIMETNKTDGNAAPAMSEQSQSAWERKPQTADQNPFEDTTNSRPVSPPSNPFGEGAAVAAGGAAAAAAHSKSPSIQSDSTHADKLSGGESVPQTPQSANFGTAAALPLAAGRPGQGPPPGPRGPNNVHRVQLDFKPSMDDELELFSGQLVRMLHEYDDGWALCIRMDRSQQGVTPRTCLSKLPVKPRPQGPPPNGPNGRPMTPQGRPMTPQGRPMTPQGRPMTPQGRPMTPQGGPGMPRAGPPVNGDMTPRPLTPNSQNRSPPKPMGRATPAAPQQGESPDRSMSITSTSTAGMPARKPVPGQAI